MDRPGRLLQLLSDGEFHSGESLGEALSVSRTAVWKQIGGLKEKGLEIESVRGEGYRVAGGLDLLDAGYLAAGLTADQLTSVLQFELKMDTASTNEDALAMLNGNDGNTAQPCLVLAEHQTDGKGRRGRSWLSPFAGSIMMSFGWQFDGGVSAIEGLSLVIGLRIQEVLQQSGLGEVKLKWPNDVVWRNRKMAGVLVEIQGDIDGPCQVVIGLGLNVNFRHQGLAIEQPWVDLVTAGQEEGLAIDLPRRNDLVLLLAKSITQLLNEYEHTGFVAYRDSWQARDAFFGAPVCLSAGSSSWEGIAAGVGNDGSYGIEIDGKTQYFSGGEISLGRVA
jgi:BirA family biotin operon repressor/biotin-[acetyl-CoA-carboxylase] ligase